MTLPFHLFSQDKCLYKLIEQMITEKYLLRQIFSLRILVYPDTHAYSDSKKKSVVLFALKPALNLWYCLNVRLLKFNHKTARFGPQGNWHLCLVKLPVLGVLMAYRILS